VRLLTPKASATGKKSTKSKSKGCAFLEFDNRRALQQALKLHQSKLDGRTINVELTVGGGGKSETRLKKLRERNKDLNTQRVSSSDSFSRRRTLNVRSVEEARRN
jgi:nucleolar protein 6